MDTKAATKEMKQRGSLALKVFLTPEVGTLIPILILSIVTGMLNQTFFTWKYISSILRDSIFIGTAALAQGVVIMSGEIDLSVGMGGCFAGIMMGVACQNWGWGLVPCILVCLATGAAVGLINALCITRLNLNSWITTLATQFISTGLAITIGDGVPLSISVLGTSGFTRARPLNLSWLFFIFVGMIIMLDLIIRKTKFGYRLRAVGGNREAAQMAGINVKKIKLIVFLLAGVIAACGGMFDVLSKASAKDTYGMGREFRAIICCAIGGITMSGGAGSMYGVGLGVLLFHVLRGCLNILNVDTNVQLVMIGAVLVMAVILDVLRKRLEDQRVIKL